MHTLLYYNTTAEQRNESWAIICLAFKTRNAFNFTRHSRATILLLLLTKCSHFYTDRAVFSKWNFVAWIITKRSYINEDAMCH